MDKCLSTCHPTLIPLLREGWTISGKPSAERSFDKFLEEAIDASLPHSFQETYATTAPNITSAPSHDNPTVARYSLSGQVPKLIDTLPLAERIHAALVELSDGSSIFTGCDESGVPLKGNANAYILSESNYALGRGRDGEITYITIYAPAGLGMVERAALEDLKEVYGSGLQIQLTLMGLGLPGDFAGLDASKGRGAHSWPSLGRGCHGRPSYQQDIQRPCAGVPKRDSNGLQIGSPEHELRRLLGLDGFPDPLAVEPVSFTELYG